MQIFSNIAVTWYPQTRSRLNVVLMTVLMCCYYPWLTVLASMILPAARHIARPAIRMFFLRNGTSFKLNNWRAKYDDVFWLDLMSLLGNVTVSWTGSPCTFPRQIINMIYYKCGKYSCGSCTSVPIPKIYYCLTAFGVSHAQNLQRQAFGISRYLNPCR